MGICPCTRDKQSSMSTCNPTGLTEPISPIIPKETDVPSNDQSLSQSSDLSIPWLLRPFEDYYEVTGDVWTGVNERLVRAVYIGTRQSCVVLLLDKQKHRREMVARTDVLLRLAKLHHPSLLKTYEIFQDTKHFFTVSESFDGGDLGDYVRIQGRLSPNVAATIIYQVLSALNYCHQQGVAHGRLNFGNIVFKSPPSENAICVKVMGLESVEQQRESRIWPQSCFRCVDPTPSEKTDIWSCGVLLYAMLSGKLPFPITAKPQKRSKPIPFPFDDWRGMNPEAMALLSTMLSRDPEDRPTVQQCLGQPWVQKCANMTVVTAKPVRASLAKLKFSEMGSPLKDACLRFIINRVLDDHEKSEAGTIFQALDRSGEGKISEESLLESLRRIMPEDKAREKVREALASDANADRSLDFSEFLISSISHRKLLSETTLKQVWSSLDRDGNRKVSMHELRYFFRANSAPGLETEWKDIEATCFKPGKDEMEYHEFEQLLLQERRRTKHMTVY